jgi:predicted AAA+ superfamily ATPase
MQFSPNLLKAQETMKRLLENDLLQWKQNKRRKPLLIRGARQVGKSHLVESFGNKHFNNVIAINFELSPQYKACFNSSLDPEVICNAIRIVSQQPIEAGNTLLFLDEIQDCPEAIQALRYFKEKMPELHVIGAGSLLELTLRQANFRMPVGRITSLYLYPLSFKEFLLNFNPQALEAIEQATVAQPVQEAIHNHLLEQLKLYLILGGMPEVLATYQNNKNLQETQALQADILSTYQSDFGHYEQLASPELLRKCFEQLPLMVGQQIKYNKIDPDLRSRELKKAIAALEAAQIFQRVQASSAQGLPLNADINEKKFKLNFIDVGLVKRVNQLDASLLLNEDPMLLNQGALTEQFVGQELMAYSANYEKADLYFWARDGSAKAEVDYITAVENRVTPIEVKSGKIGKLRSLKQFMLERDSALGLRISQLPLQIEGKVLSLPLYMVSELERLLKNQTK